MGGAGKSLITGIIIVAVLFVLVRPGSKGPSLIKTVTSGIGGLIGKATGGGTWAKG